MVHILLSFSTFRLFPEEPKGLRPPDENAELQTLEQTLVVDHERNERLKKALKAETFWKLPHVTPSINVIHMYLLLRAFVMPWVDSHLEDLLMDDPRSINYSQVNLLHVASV